MNSNKKKVLKTIVKECLIEILAEGLVGNNVATVRESRELRGALQETYERTSDTRITSQNLNQPTQVLQSRPAQAKRQSSYLDTMQVGDNSIGSSVASQAIQSKVKSITSDPIMSDILADTAMTTLREQKEGSRPSGPSVMASGDSAARMVDQSSPEDLFGGQANNWANLAFAPSVRK
jgi:hypothetical protein